MTPKLIFIPVFAAAALAASQSPASAETVSFRYSANELKNAKSAEALYARMTAKTERVCEDPGPQAPAHRRIENECVGALIDEFVAKIDSPRLARIHDVKRGGVFTARSR